jgi:hypothetical protein
LCSIPRIKAGLIRKAAALTPDTDELSYVVCAREAVEHPDTQTRAVTAADIFTAGHASSVVKAAYPEGLRPLLKSGRGSALGQPHYYRLQGPRLVIEYDNTRRQANHARSVWRDPAADFGCDTLGRT